MQHGILCSFKYDTPWYSLAHYFSLLPFLLILLHGLLLFLSMTLLPGTQACLLHQYLSFFPIALIFVIFFWCLRLKRIISDSLAFSYLYILFSLFDLVLWDWRGILMHSDALAHFIFYNFDSLQFVFGYIFRWPSFCILLILSYYLMCVYILI